ncbi:imidazole glycerol phosphate synthase subunit HisH [Pigmentiphaga sp. NML080357]|uniref:imidazole glycerol phosphate synthase subunit HisH n=1 Tax=Pigmentiphaga sp. NML080357 TaxID=2008675 RepID=UPI000B40856B|nr:imidazole glycerol phosphate synthase subunit HisH [Pigmentiphaga sp. NML080357]OVZ59503.1 imidazole glycerol phosphate synthase subunit HisH [Pigmentiphaga sp. NML080357]
MIAIIDYGSGNVAAIATILKQAKIPHQITRNHKELQTATRYILPGVGAFDATMKELESSGTVEVLNEEVLGKGKKILGICVGMQILAESSEEGSRSGLGWIGGRVRRIDERSIERPPRLPHMGWNSIDVKGDSSLFHGVDAKVGFYFLHSYYFDASDPSVVAATVTHGSNMTCAVAKTNVYGVQFHPEKSHDNGVRLLCNFAEM